MAPEHFIFEEKTIDTEKYNKSEKSFKALYNKYSVSGNMLEHFACRYMKENKTEREINQKINRIIANFIECGMFNELIYSLKNVQPQNRNYYNNIVKDLLLRNNVTNKLFTRHHNEEKTLKQIMKLYVISGSVGIFNDFCNYLDNNPRNDLVEYYNRILNTLCNDDKDCYLKLNDFCNQFPQTGQEFRSLASLLPHNYNTQPNKRQRPNPKPNDQRQDSSPSRP